jgi:nucleoside phosphorylase
MNSSQELKILLVEDDPNWKTYIAQKLRQALVELGRKGRVLTLEDFEQAWDALNQDGPWHLLVTDIGLRGPAPSQPHQQMGKHLVEQAHKLRVPCIVVSGTPSLTPTHVVTFLKQLDVIDIIWKIDFTADQFIKGVKEALIEFSKKAVEIVILTVLHEEYQAVRLRLSNPRPVPIKEAYSDLYAWISGEIPSANNSEPYSVVLGMTGRAGNVSAALATIEAINHWKPKYLFFVGIAGGFDLDGLQKGDVVVADVIHGYEYGKVEKDFLPRDHWTFATDQGLVNNAMRFAVSTDEWKSKLQVERPVTSGVSPKVIRGQIASGEKVVDDPTNEFFVQIRKKWPKLLAVEMEGAGVASAIEVARSRGLLTRFLVIRGISDMPMPDTGQLNRGTHQRDAWKSYAASAAAAFVVSFISDGLPVTLERVAG